MSNLKETCIRLFRMIKILGYLYTLKRVADSLYARSIGKMAFKKSANGVFALRSASERFQAIYESNYWGNLESRSGTGSTREATMVFSRSLDKFIKEKSINSLFDAPCGDWNWMRYQRLPPRFIYIGGEIVPSLVYELNEKYKRTNHTFILHDITCDPFPESDAWLCRDCLFHLSFRDILKALENYSASQIPFAMLTSHYSSDSNRDIQTADFRPLNLLAYPFFLPLPEYILDETVGNELRYVGVWPKDVISKCVDKMKSLPLAAIGL